MKSGRNIGVARLRRFIVDALVGAATLAVAIAATGTTASVPYMLSIVGALVGIGLILEPSIRAQPGGETNSLLVRPPTEFQT